MRPRGLITPKLKATVRIDTAEREICDVNLEDYRPPQRFQVSRPALSCLLNRKAGLSGGMALRIEKAFGVKMDTLMRMQSAYDIAQTRKREKEVRVRRIRSSAEVHL